MMEFIGLTLSIALGITLSMVIILVLAFNPLVMRIYAKFMMKSMNTMFETMIDNEEEKDQ